MKPRPRGVGKGGFPWASSDIIMVTIMVRKYAYCQVVLTIPEISSSWALEIYVTIMPIVIIYVWHETISCKNLVYDSYTSIATHGN